MDTKKVVIIEDNAKLAQMLSRIFAGNGYNAIYAANGLDGVEKVCEENPDFIALDPAITDINGCHVYRLLKNDPRFVDTPILILIESERDRLRLRGIKPQIEQNIIKFTSEDELKEDITRLLERFGKRTAVNKFQVQSEQFKAVLERLTEAYRLGKSLASEQARDVLEELLNKIITMLDSELGSLMLLEEETQELVIKAAKGLGEDIIGKTRVKLGTGISGWVAKRGVPLLIRNIEEDERFSKENAKKYYTSSLLSAPIRANKEVLGVINVNNKSTKEPFTECDLSLLTVLTGEISMAIEASRLQKELESANEKMERLKNSRDILVNVTRSLDDELYELTISQEVSNMVYSRLDYKEIVTAILEIIERSIDCHLCGLLFVDEENRAEAMIEVKYPTTQDEIDAFNSRMIETFNDLSGGSLLRQEASLTTINEPNVIDTYAGSRDILSSYRANLLLAGERPVGVLAITNSFPNAFTGEDIKIFSIISRHSSIAINNTLLHKKIKELSVTDGLTGLYVYRYFNDALEKEIQRAARYQQDFSLIMLDIDGFKKVNDDFGHLQGDEVLKELSQILRKVCRQVDIIARYGGEEFMIILPETDTEGAYILAERIRMVVKNYVFGTKDAPINLTVSIGVASYPESATSKLELIKEVDRALYRAKTEGKNKVCRAAKEIKNEL